VPEDLSGEKTRDLPGRGDDAIHGRPPAEHRVERVSPENRPALPARESEQPEPGWRPAEDPQSQARRRRGRLVIAAIVGAVLLLAASVLGWYWYTTWRWLESTDDAYTQADNTAIVPRVSGYISDLLVTDNQRVKAGEVLLRIDPRDYQAAVDQAQSDVLAAEANLRSLDAQISQQQATIEQARADVASAESDLTFAQQEYARYTTLAKTGAGTVQRAQQAATDLRDKAAALKHNQAALAGAEKQIDVLRTQRAQVLATLLHDRAVLDQARLNLGYTVIKAPIDGAVGDRAARVGLYVQPGTQLMTIVPMGSGVYVVANYKETQIGRMFRGEAADISVDAFSGTHLHGTLDSLAPGSGQVFALLPPENATGNFTKIVQRVPVKILIDPSNDPVLDRIRAGLSVEATVDTRTAPPEGGETLVPPPRGAS
jgi:membrane fusion protein (multidrug efflux system)